MNDTEPHMIVLPTLDSEELAAQNKASLDMFRWRAQEIGRETVKVCTQGYYVNRLGEQVNISDDVRAAIAGKRSISPDDVLVPSNQSFEKTIVQVSNETTLVAAKRVARDGQSVLALNFANGIEPGGGFLSGARAQEENLCRSSALYPTLVDDRMYSAHRLRELPDSTDWVIYSPNVPVFRADDGAFLDGPWKASFLTCAAPYAPRVGVEESVRLMDKRIHRVLAVAASLGYKRLVLGAWGCGAFGNSPTRTADNFSHAIAGAFLGAFEEVVFAITDWSRNRDFLHPFATAFGRHKS